MKKELLGKEEISLANEKESVTDNYFKVRKQLFMKKTINWQFDVKDGIGEWAKITLFNLNHEATQNLINCLRRKIDKPGFGSLEYMGKTAEEIAKENWQQVTVKTYGDKQYRFLKLHNHVLLSADGNIKLMFEINCMKADNATTQLCIALKIWQGSKSIRELKLKEFLFTAFVIKLEEMSSHIL